jgi:hypothetical protein
MRLARARLADGGAAEVSVRIDGTSPAELAALLRAARAVFAHVALTRLPSRALLIASRGSVAAARSPSDAGAPEPSAADSALDVVALALESAPANASAGAILTKALGAN